jgi:cob(I)alamin adenosyltransferase
LIGAAIYIARSYPSDSVIRQMTKDIETQLKTQYDEDIAAKEKQIEYYQKQYEVSRAQVDTLKKKVKKLETDVVNIKKPQTTQETKDRFRALGYPPVR